jgi:hypothetical protein
VLRKAPPLPFVRDAVHIREVVICAFMHSGDIGEGQRLVEPIRDFMSAWPGPSSDTIPATCSA